MYEYYIVMFVSRTNFILLIMIKLIILEKNYLPA